MSQTRTVSNGRDFTASIKSAIIGGGKFCVCCKRERATQVDHIHALQFGGSSDIDNATALCGRCHFEKSRAEANANTAQMHLQRLECSLHDQRAAAAAASRLWGPAWCSAVCG